MAGRSVHSRNRLAIAWAPLAAALLGGAASAQAPADTEDASPVTRGIYNWVHTTGDAERAFAFYRDVLGIELAASPFAGNPDAPPEGIRPVADAASDALVWNLTNTTGSRFRTVFMRATNTPFGLELSEFFDIPRDERPANPWDPGASKLIFTVRDLEAVVARLRARQASTVTLGGAPVETPTGRSLLVRDPDGYLVQVTQASPREIAGAVSLGEVVSTSIAITVSDTPAALEFYGDLLGFEIGETRLATRTELGLHGVTDAQLIRTTARIPGTGATVLFYDFELSPTATEAANPYSWKIQDVGAPQFQLEVAGLNALLERTTRAGYRFLSVDANPIERPFGRFVFAIDPDGVLVEFVEPAAQ